MFLFKDKCMTCLCMYVFVYRKCVFLYRFNLVDSYWAFVGYVVCLYFRRYMLIVGSIFRDILVVLI